MIIFLDYYTYYLAKIYFHFPVKGNTCVTNQLLTVSISTLYINTSLCRTILEFKYHLVRECFLALP